MAVTVPSILFAPDSNPQPTIYAFIIYSQTCAIIVFPLWKDRKINIKEAGLVHLLNFSSNRKSDQKIDNKLNSAKAGQIKKLIKIAEIGMSLKGVKIKKNRVYDPLRGSLVMEPLSFQQQKQH